MTVKLQKLMILFTEADVYRYTRKQVFLKILQNSPQKCMCLSLFLNKIAGWRPVTLLKKRLWQMRFLKILRSF